MLAPEYESHRSTGFLFYGYIKALNAPISSEKDCFVNEKTFKHRNSGDLVALLLFHYIYPSGKHSSKSERKGTSTRRSYHYSFKSWQGSAVLSQRYKINFRSGLSAWR